MAVKCPKCQTDNPDTQKFCGECAAPLPSEDVHITKTLETPKEELTTGSTFAERYQIIEELGKGGMGKVYKVLDKETDEKVALKLIKPEIALDKKTIERFRNELKFARKVSHRNVCRMYDLNKEKENYYITMEYVSGGDLKTFIRRAAPLSTSRTITIAKQICEGLTEAHKLGLVHRDLKPSNIMIDDDGNVRIMDFGIARSLKEKGITGAGVMIGTPEYMSPEQVEGKEVDQQSDIYSLGIILYEMVTGKVPFEGDTPFTIGMKHKGEMPQDPKELNTQIPDDLNDVILRCLEKDREKRFQSADEVQSELENIEKGIPTTKREVTKGKPATSKEITVTISSKKLLIPALVVITLIAIALIIWKPWLQKEIAPSLSKKPSIAVLPFADLSPQKDHEYLCDGVAETLINSLSSIKDLHVPARTSAFSFKGKGLDIKEIGQKLNVETVLEGSVQVSGGKLRISARLSNVDDGYQLWSESYERGLDDIFALQDAISLAIVDNLKIQLLGGEREKLVKRHTENMDAYNLYLQGRFLWNKRNEADLKKAIDYFEQAIKIDPDYAMAYVGLADTYTVLPYYSPLPGKEAFPKAKEAALKAVEIDNTIAEAYPSLGNLKILYDYDWEGGVKELRRAIELSPGNAKAHHWLGMNLMRIGRFEEANKEMKRALELDPLSLVLNRNLGALLYYSRQYDLAIEAFQKTIEMNPSFSEAHAFLGLAYLEKSKYEEALEELQKEKALTGGRHPLVDCWIGIVYVRMGKRDKAQELMDDLLKRSKETHVGPMSLATLFLVLGEKEQGFMWMEKAYEERAAYMINLGIFPYFDNVRSDPRFKALLKKIGLDD